jgi:uncharacterized membrane protein
MAAASNPVVSSGNFAKPARIVSIDVLRGIVMVVMALDHVRDYMTHLRFAPEDPSQTYPALFFTRFITHFCAPSFFFLAGTGAFLAARNKSVSKTAKTLWTRGLWLILLEFTVLWWGWTFTLKPQVPILLVIWALGCSMIFLSALVRLPVKWIAAIGLAMIFGHNLFDKIRPGSFGSFSWLWIILHKQGFIHLHFKGGPQGVFSLYPLVPWVGVMAAGYAFGALYSLDTERRKRLMLRIGTAAVTLFAILRATNLYGNPPLGFGAVSPGDFKVQKTLSLTVIAFFDTEKYPPSLQFLLMTLGPAIIFLALMEGVDLKGMAARVAAFFRVYGAVPMFYYIPHIYLAHLLAIAVGASFHQPYQWLVRGGFFTQPAPDGWGFNLPIIWLTWAVCVGLLYYPCRWYAKYKATHKKWWLSYL